MDRDGKLRFTVLFVLLGTVGCPAQSSVQAEDLPTPVGPAAGSSGSQGSITNGESGEQTDTSASTSTSGDPSTSEPGPSSSTSETADCLDGCSSPPNTCYLNEGTCISGACEYEPKPVSTPCSDGDACTMVDECDGAGTCVGSSPLSCERENAEGGTCVDGECGGWTCIEPYEDCDQDWSNGCEVPTGVPNSCNANGLSETNACGTAYCGIEVAPNAINFMAQNYRCVTCSNCSTPEEGEVAWCNQATGGWFTPEAGDCPAFYEGATCQP